MPDKKPFYYRASRHPNEETIVRMKTDGEIEGIGETDPTTADWAHISSNIHISIKKFIEPY